MNKAMNLGYYDFLDDLPLVNREVAEYRSIDVERIFDFSRRTFPPETGPPLIYRARR